MSCPIKLKASYTDDGSQYDDYFKAYSVAIMDRKDRPELLYGGKSESSPTYKEWNEWLTR
jgi:hypothetical protein